MELIVTKIFDPHITNRRRVMVNDNRNQSIRDDNRTISLKQH